MPVKQMDAVSSFQHVVDHIPQWRTDISALTQHAASKHKEYVAEYSRVLDQVRSKRQKSASMTSLRTADEDEQTKEAPKSPQLSELIDINPFEAGNRYIYAQAHKKRKPGTSIRSGASGPRPYRNKQMVIIYYDSHIQAELDKLVKAFGAARNNLRKGKNAYNATRGFSLPGLNRRYDHIDNLVPNPMARAGPRLAKASGDTFAVTSTDVQNPETAFTRTDKEIEQIQNLCETAAHQAIRDGDCSKELQETASKLDTLQAMAQSCLDMLKAAEDEESYKLENASVSDNTSTQSTLCEKPSMEALTIAHKIPPSVDESVEVLKRSTLPTILSASGVPIVADAIEVDDEEDDSSVEVEIDMNDFRATSRRVVA